MRVSVSLVLVIGSLQNETGLDLLLTLFRVANLPLQLSRAPKSLWRRHCLGLALSSAACFAVAAASAGVAGASVTTETDESGPQCGYSIGLGKSNRSEKL